MNETRELLENVGGQYDFPEHAFEGLRRRRDRKRRNQRLAAGVLAIAIFVVPVAWIAATGGWGGGAPAPADDGPTVGPAFPTPALFLDLRTGAKTQVAATLRGGTYAVSPDGTMFAYSAEGDFGKPQIFIAGVDGTGVLQMTHDLAGATWPAWSPDGTKIAYGGYGSGVFVLDVATGSSTRVAEGFGHLGLQFTPDGKSLIYTSTLSTSHPPHLQVVSIDGGKSKPLVDPPKLLEESGDGSISPEGSLVTYLGNEAGRPGPIRWVANIDGTDRRVLRVCSSNPAGTWSPDGSRIVCSFKDHIVVIDIVTGDVSRVTDGARAIWIDGNTLLIEP